MELGVFSRAVPCSGRMEGSVSTTLSRTTPPVVFFLGGPGSGKGTCSQRVSAENPDFVYFSVGSLLRAEKQSGSELGKAISGLIDRGVIVPPEMSMAVMRRALEAHAHHSAVLIDGFPRSLQQDDGWVESFGLPALVVVLDSSEECMRLRLSERSRTSGRADDKVSVLDKRFEQYATETRPVEQRYAALEGGRLLLTVNAMQDKESVYQDVKNGLIHKGIWTNGH
ncbi:adenylate kinase/UMP-CMP kinase [Kipferlia bialata]|uniref:Adenylate kinase/UMP-CMP kinase n=1 Tax=Kipferlia bialata TaxID=797122 RepID=A0A9K3GIQ9_9EUKA|nr:adenylate kinase/UMP-CMP kinase [Kipferlia bialata]|eukprot:g5974.t1